MTEHNHTIPALTHPNDPSPLMQPVDYQGQIYFTSQYFHRQYLEQSPHGGKYRQHGNFLQAIRAIPAYELYIASADIAEISWNAIKERNDVLNEVFIYFKILFHAAGYRPLTLLNATAQVALTHHLDDALSQQMSVAANTAIARQMTKRSVSDLLPTERAARELEALMQIGRLLQTPPHIVQQESVKMIEVTTGVNLRPLLKPVPAQSQLEEEDLMLEPTDLGKRLGFSSGKVVNVLLEQLGWQEKFGSVWEPTPLGEPYAARHAWQSDHGTKSGYNYKWRLSAVRRALQHAGLLS